MFDSLEGLDYAPGECSRYVMQVLSDVKLSKAKGDLVEIPAENLQIGDVVVGGWSSHLVTKEDYYPRTTITPQNARRDETGQILDPLILIIPKKVLERKRMESDESHNDNHIVKSIN